MKKIKLYYKQFIDGKSADFMLLMLLLFGIILLFIPLLLTQFSWISLNYQNEGEIGDILGGTTAPFLGFAGIVVTFYAFWVQYQANINQRNDIKLERFENQFYEMLRLHKENVLEMEIETIKGRKCFVRMFYEFKYIYLSTYQMYLDHKEELNREYSKEELCDLAYRIFFNGLNSISDLELKEHPKMKDAKLLIHVYRYLRKSEEYYEKEIKISLPVKTIYNEERTRKFNFEIFYYPFDGHNTRLGHYYRHLFQTVSLIADSTFLKTHKEKYHYLKLLRAQLSNHEQLLLYYNGLVSFGNEWIKKNYFTDYRMIKNIPFDKADFGIQPKDKLGRTNRFGEAIFEWIE